jgi:hypothetical protein
MKQRALRRKYPRCLFFLEKRRILSEKDITADPKELRTFWTNSFSDGMKNRRTKAPSDKLITGEK